MIRDANQIFLLAYDLTYTNLLDFPFKTWLNSDTKYLEFLDTIPCFAKEIKFDEFYKNNTVRYKKYVDTVKADLEARSKTDIVSFLNNYYNIPTSKKYVINLLPTVSYYWYGTKNSKEIHSNIPITPDSTSDENLFYNYNYLNSVLSMIHHEFSHSFINPLTDKHELIKNDNPIFSGIAEQMKALGYDTNYKIINEHIIRAATIRYAAITFPDKDYHLELTKYERKNGFAYIDAILEALVIYENNRDIYPNIDVYYPKIIDSMVNENKKKSNREK